MYHMCIWVYTTTDGDCWERIKAKGVKGEQLPLTCIQRAGCGTSPLLVPLPSRAPLQQMQLIKGNILTKGKHTGTNSPASEELM